MPQGATNLKKSCLSYYLYHQVSASESSVEMVQYIYFLHTYAFSKKRYYNITNRHSNLIICVYV